MDQIITKPPQWHKSKHSTASSHSTRRLHHNLPTILSQTHSSEKSAFSANLCSSPIVWGICVSLASCFFVLVVIWKLVYALFNLVRRDDKEMGVWTISHFLAAVACTILELLGILIGGIGISSGLTTILSVKYILSITFTCGICFYVAMSSIAWSIFVFTVNGGDINAFNLCIFIVTSLLVGFIFGISLVQFLVVKQARILYQRERMQRSYLELEEGNAKV